MAAIAPSILVPGFVLRKGSGLDRALLVKFMQRTYRELHPNQNFGHLAETVDRHLSGGTPLWWVDAVDETWGGLTDADAIHLRESSPNTTPQNQPIACLWLGNGIDQVQGKRYAHIMLLYVAPEQRRQGIGSALVSHAEQWARDRGDSQIGLQVFQNNHPALRLYQQLNYQTQAVWMVKALR